MADAPTFIKKRAPTLYLIIAIQLFKGALCLTLALIACTLADNGSAGRVSEMAAFPATEPGATAGAFKTL